MKRALYAIAIGACTVLPAGAQDTTPIADAQSSAPAADVQLGGAALLEALRRGGHVVYFRHTATDFSKNDSAMRSLDDCENQRPLSVQGREDAAAIGRQLRALCVPVGEALASPMCRTTEHARRMLGDVTPRPEIREAQAGDYAGLKRLLAAPVPRGNRFIVGHGIPFRQVAGAPHLAEGEAVVIRPEGKRWSVVARIAVGDWPTLATPR
jgi:hypothetical protein